MLGESSNLIIDCTSDGNVEVTETPPLARLVGCRETTMEPVYQGNRAKYDLDEPKACAKHETDAWSASVGTLTGPKGGAEGASPRVGASLTQKFTW